MRGYTKILDFKVLNALVCASHHGPGRLNFIDMEDVDLKQRDLRLWDVTSISSYSMKFSDYLNLNPKPNIRIGMEMYFHVDNNFFINEDLRKSNLPESYIYINSEYVQVVTNYEFISIVLNFKNTVTPANKICTNKKKQFVYVMLDKRIGYYKIGISNNPEYRESTLQSEKPDIVLLAYYEGTLKDEKFLHKKYFKNRIRGEWFNLNNNDLLQVQKYFNK